MAPSPAAPGGDGGAERAPLLARLSHLTGVDFHVLQTLLLRGWSIVAGGVMALLVPFWFDAIEQGYYYTLVSMLAVQIVFELGMSQIIIPIVSQESARLNAVSDGSLDGSRDAITRLASLVSLVTRWYRFAAVLFFVGAGITGTLFFGNNGEAGDAVAIGIWWALVAFTAINLALSPALAVLEGFGQIGTIARLRLAQSIVGYLVMWAALSAGAGLYATPFLPAAAFVITSYWLIRRDRRLHWLRSVSVMPGEARINWWRDVFPLQWRIALSWVSGYLILQLLVPMAFAYQGAVAAGQLGLTLTIFASLLTIGLSWVNARLPVIAAHIARRERAEARAVFRSVVWRAVGATSLGCVIVCVGVLLLPADLRDRFADWTTIFCLVFSTVLNCLVYALATFMRAHKEEPLLFQSLTMAAIMVPVVYISAGISVPIMMLSFVIVLALLGLPWTFFVFRRYYSREA